MLLLVPSGFAFVFAGALVAPRYKLVVAVCLATVSAILSLLIHVLTQPNPGIVNYMNSTGEFLGGLLAVAVIMVLKLIRREK